MAKNFKLLQDKMRPEARARSKGKANAMLKDMALDELRVARDLTQEHLARRLRVRQSAVSKLERRADMYISTLQQLVKAMGGSLEIRALFPEGAVRITQFSSIGKSTQHKGQAS
jgi:transcriptional regulator with XRE-family HTH domain